MSAITKEETLNLQMYLRKKLNSGISVDIREKAKDSAEIKINGEFLGTVYKDEEDGDVSYDINVVVLRDDLSDV